MIYRVPGDVSIRQGEIPMHRFLDAPRRRSLAGFVAALLFVPLMLGVTACLETPIGDPEKGWVDPRVTGAWLASDADADGQDAQLWMFEPYDSRTWLLTVVGFEEPDQATTPDAQPDVAAPAGPAAPDAPAQESAPAQAAQAPEMLERLGGDQLKVAERWVFKAWLTSIANRRFLVLEPKGIVDSESGFEPDTWFVYRIVLKGARLELAFLDLATDDLGEARTRWEAEEIIARHATDPDFYEEVGVLDRIPREAYGELSTVLERAGFSRP
jgi:hypothetical protein